MKKWLKRKWWLGSAISITIFLVLFRLLSSQSASVTLSWTAPGDDGNVGTASAYEMRYHTDSLFLVNNFSQAVAVPNMPVPLVAGTRQSVTVNGLPSDTKIYFAIKTRDDAFNWSDLSNVPFKITPDVDKPSSIIDLLPE